MSSRTPDRPDRARDGKGRWVRSPEMAARDARAADLRAEGYTFKQIADELGYSSKADAHKAVTSALRDIVAPSVAKLRRAEGDRLEYVAQRLMEIADREGAPVTAGKDGEVVVDPDSGEVVRDYSGQINALRTIVTASARLSALFGLDEPIRTDVNSTVHVQYSFGEGIDPEALS